MKSPSAEIRGVWCPAKQKSCFTWPDCACIRNGVQHTGSHEPLHRSDDRLCPTCGARPIDGLVIHSPGCTDETRPLRVEERGHVPPPRSHTEEAVSSYHPQTQEELDQMLLDWEQELEAGRKQRQEAPSRREPPTIDRAALQRREEPTP